MNFLWTFKRPSLKTPLKVCIGCKDYFLKQTYSLLVSPPENPWFLTKFHRTLKITWVTPAGYLWYWMCILRVLPENTSEKIGQERAGTEWTVVKSKIRLCIQNRSYGRFLHAASWWGLCSPYPHIVQNHMILPVGGLSQQVTAGVQMHCRENQILDFGKETPCHERRKKWNLS